MDRNDIREQLKIISWNANGLIPDTNEFAEFISDEAPDVILIQESKLNQRNPPHLPGYSYINKPHTIHGGLLTYYLNSSPAQEIPPPPSSLNSLTIRYRGIIIHNIHSTKSLTHQDLDSLFRHPGKVISFGDFNAKHPYWNCAASNTSGNRILSYLDTHNIRISFPQNSHTHYPNRDLRASTIDFALHTNIPIKSIQTINSLNSDHLPVSLCIRTRSSQTPPSQFHRIVDWAKFKVHLQSLPSPPDTLTNTTLIDEEIVKLTENILWASDKASSKKPIHSKHNPITDDIRNLITQKNNVRRQAQKQFHPDLKREANSLTAQIRAKIAAEKIRLWESRIKSVTPRNNLIWKIARQSKRKFLQIPPLHTRDSGIVHSATEKSQALAEEFHSKHLISQDLSNPKFSQKIRQFSDMFDLFHEPTPPESQANPSELRAIIKKLKPKKAPGVDQVTNSHLRNLPNKTLTQLLVIINSCIELQYFPTTWKHATVVAIPKPGKNPIFPFNYRPISLLPAISKILERIILNRLNTIIETNDTIPPFQYGFRKDRGTVMQLHRTLHLIAQSLNNAKITTFLTLDIESAFDSVWHDAIIFKLFKLNFPTYLIKILKSYLANRSFQVKVNNMMSTPQSIPAGVPQGGVLSPTLFNIFTSDIPTHPRTNIALFADDAAIFASAGKQKLSNQLVQEHANLLETYYRQWRIRINQQKSQIIHFFKHSKCQSPHAKVTLNSHAIPESNTVKYLGLTLDSKLSFNQHLESRKSLTQAAIQTYHQVLRSSINLKSKILLYKNGILPILTYACPVWSNLPDYKLDGLETLNNAAMRKILLETRQTPGVHMRQRTQLPTIRQRILQLATNYYTKTAMKVDTIKTLLLQDYENPPAKSRSCKLPHHRFIGRLRSVVK